MIRRLSIALLALFGGACDGSPAKSDGGFDHHTTSSFLVGTIDPGGPACISAPVLIVDGQAQCTVTQHLAGDGGVKSTTLSPCLATAQGPCWSLVSNPTACPDGELTFTFDPDPANPSPAPNSLSYDYNCMLSD